MGKLARLSVATILFRKCFYLRQKSAIRYLLLLICGLYICSPEVVTLSIEPPSQVVSFTELSKQAQLSHCREMGKVANPCGPLTLDIVSSR